MLVLVDGDTVFEPRRDRALVAAVRRPDGRRGHRQHQGRQPARAARPLAAHRVRHRLQPRPPHVRRAPAACRPCPARSARSAARRSTDVGGVSDDTLAEDTDLTMAICRAGWRVVYEPERPRLDRGAGRPRPAVAAALPLVLRHHAGDVEAPPRRASSAAPRGRLGRRGLPYLLLFQVLLPLLAPGRSTSSRVYGLVFLRSRDDRARLAGLPGSAGPHRRPTRSRSTGSALGRCGRCRCSSSSTGS